MPIRAPPLVDRPHQPLQLMLHLPGPRPCSSRHLSWRPRLPRGMWRRASFPRRVQGVTTSWKTGRSLPSPTPNPLRRRRSPLHPGRRMHHQGWQTTRWQSCWRSTASSCSSCCKSARRRPSRCAAHVTPQPPSLHHEMYVTRNIRLMVCLMNCVHHRLLCLLQWLSHCLILYLSSRTAAGPAHGAGQAPDGAGAAHGHLPHPHVQEPAGNDAGGAGGSCGRAAPGDRPPAGLALIAGQHAAAAARGGRRQATGGGRHKDGGAAGEPPQHPTPNTHTHTRSPLSVSLPYTALWSRVGQLMEIFRPSSRCCR